MKLIQLFVILVTALLFLQCKCKKEEVTELIWDLETLCFYAQTRDRRGSLYLDLAEGSIDSIDKAYFDGNERCRSRAHSRLSLIQEEGANLDSLITEYKSIVDGHSMKHFLNSDEPYY